MILYSLHTRQYSCMNPSKKVLQGHIYGVTSTRCNRSRRHALYSDGHRHSTAQEWDPVPRQYFEAVCEGSDSLEADSIAPLQFPSE